VTIPLPAFLIEHARGLVLFDTSLNPKAAEDAEGTYPDLAPLMAGLQFPSEARIDRQLQALGFAPGDVTHVVLSHAHFDHVGGMHLFSEATFLVGEDEMPFAFWPDPVTDPFYRQSELEFLRGVDLRQVHGDLDLFGDGALVLLHTPGHTPGHQSLLVRLGSQSVLLAADVVHLREGLAGVPFPGDWDTREMRRSARRVVQLAEAEQATLWIAHDPRDWERRTPPPGTYE